MNSGIFAALHFWAASWALSPLTEPSPMRVGDFTMKSSIAAISLFWLYSEIARMVFTPYCFAANSKASPRYAYHVTAQGMT